MGIRNRAVHGHSVPVQHVEQAREVGRRRDTGPAILVVDTAVALSQGLAFYRSDSGVWLSGPVPAAAIGVLDAGG